MGGIGYSALMEKMAEKWAKEAIEKQFQKIVSWEHGTDKPVYCPACNSQVAVLSRYCSYCGQALEWCCCEQ